MPALLSRLRRSETVQATIPPRLSSHALGNAGLSPLETDFTGVSRNLAGVPQLIAMHTARAIRDPAVTKPEGIAFWLACGEEKVHCLVTRAALIFLAGCFLLERDYEKVFGTYREDIERTAAWKYRLGHGRRLPLTVNVHDLIASGSELGVSDDTPATVG